MHLHQFNQILEQLQQLARMGGWVTIVAALFAGLALTYAGRKVYWFGVFLGGMFFGTLFGAGLGLAFGFSDIGLACFALFCGFFGGSVAISAVYFGVLLLGMFAGVMLGMAGGIAEPVILLIIAVICGGISIALYNFAIIVSTAVSGSIILTWSVINGFALLQYGSMAFARHSPVSYGMRVAKSAWASGSIDGAVRTLSGDFFVFLFFLVTGIAFQMNFDRIIGALLFNGKSKSLTKPKSSMRNSEVAHSFSPVAALNQPQRQIAEPATCVVQETLKYWTLFLFENGEKCGQQQLAEGEYILGREQEVDFLLDDPAVSRRHLRLRVSDRNHIMLKDLGSANGTWRFGKDRVELEQPSDGDWYQMGRAQIMFKQNTISSEEQSQ